MIEFLHEWQTLIGAFLGSFFPLLALAIYEKRERRQELLRSVNRFLVYNINNLADVHRNVELFLNKRLQGLIERAKQRRSEESFCIGAVFFPLFARMLSYQEVLNIRTKSNYLDNLFIQVVKMSRDVNSTIDDSREQIRDTIETNRAIALEGRTTPNIQCTQFIENLEDFKRSTRKQFLDENFQVYLEKLLYARVALARIIGKFGLYRWKFKYESHFKFFLNKKALDEFKKNTHERIEQDLKDEVEKEKERILSSLDPD